MRDKLGDINNGIRAQSGHAAWQQNIAGRACEREVAGEGAMITVRMRL